jgi:chemotaxis protein MotB
MGIKDNWDLSYYRAKRVLEVLQNKFNVNPSNIIVAGRGHFKPLIINGMRNKRHNNRRIRIVLIPILDK